MRVCETATREGHQIFINELTRVAQRADDSRITALIDELHGPLRVAVRGRDGVGRETVAAALAGAGLSVADDTSAEVNVVVVAEALFHFLETSGLMNQVATSPIANSKPPIP